MGLLCLHCQNYYKSKFQRECILWKGSNRVFRLAKSRLRVSSHRDSDRDTDWGKLAAVVEPLPVAAVGCTAAAAVGPCKG